MHVAGIVIRLRVIAVNLGYAARFHVPIQKIMSIANGEPDIGKPPLIGAPSGVADRERQRVNAQVQVARSPDRTADEKAAIPATEIEHHRPRPSEKTLPIQWAVRR